MDMNRKHGAAGLRSRGRPASCLAVLVQTSPRGRVVDGFALEHAVHQPAARDAWGRFETRRGPDMASASQMLGHAGTYLVRD
jgi:hypothetical protein